MAFRWNQQSLHKCLHSGACCLQSIHGALPENISPLALPSVKLALDLACIEFGTTPVHAAGLCRVTQAECKWGCTAMQLHSRTGKSHADLLTNALLNYVSTA